MIKLTLIEQYIVNQLREQVVDGAQVGFYKGELSWRLTPNRYTVHYRARTKDERRALYRLDHDRGLIEASTRQGWGNNANLADPGEAFNVTAITAKFWEHIGETPKSLCLIEVNRQIADTRERLNRCILDEPLPARCPSSYDIELEARLWQQRVKGDEFVVVNADFVYEQKWQRVGANVALYERDLDSLLKARAVIGAYDEPVEDPDDDGCKEAEQGYEQYLENIGAAAYAGSAEEQADRDYEDMMLSRRNSTQPSTANPSNVDNLPF